MKKTLLVVILSIIPLTGCILLGMYSYTTTVKFTEIVRLPDGEDVTIKRKQWIKKENYLVGKSSLVIKERLTIIDPDNGKKLPFWETDYGDLPYLLIKKQSKSCLWNLITRPSTVSSIIKLEKINYIKEYKDNGEQYYEPTVVSYCFNQDSQEWIMSSVSDEIIGKEGNIWLNSQTNIPSSIIIEKDGESKNKWSFPNQGIILKRSKI